MRNGRSLLLLPVQVYEQQHGGQHNKPIGFAKTHGNHLVDAHN